MPSSDFTQILLLVLCATTADALFWKRDSHPLLPITFPQVKREASVSPSNSSTWSGNFSAIVTPVNNFTCSDPPSDTQGAVVTATVPIYTVCNLPGASTPASCSTAHDTITTSSCSTTITAAFNRFPISDCEQNVTFSTHSSYSVVTLSSTAISTPGLNKRASLQTQSTYIQRIVTYHVCHWRSLTSGDPSDITLIICKTDFAGQVSCENVREVWVVYTDYVPSTITSLVHVDQFFLYPAVLQFGAGHSINVDSGHVNFRTSIVYNTTTARCLTSTSRQLAAPAVFVPTPRTSTTTLTSTYFVSAAGTTITITVMDALPAQSAAALSAESTTTLTSYTTVTSTVTVAS